MEQLKKTKIPNFRDSSDDDNEEDVKTSKEKAITPKTSLPKKEEAKKPKKFPHYLLNKSNKSLSRYIA
jgi:hypothetical protein